MLNADPKVVEYAVEPHVLTYWDMDGAGGAAVKRTYTPDVVVRYVDGAIAVLDAKAAFFGNRANWASKAGYIREAYREDHGVPFQVITESHIRVEPRLSNCQFMLRFRDAPVDPRIGYAVRELLAVHKKPTIGFVQNATVSGLPGANRASIMATLMQFALAGEIVFDLSKPIDPATVIEAEDAQ